MFAMFHFSIRLQDAFKTSLQNVFKNSSRRLQDVFLKTSRSHFEDVMKKTSCKHVLKTSWKYINVKLRMSLWPLQHVFTKTNVCWPSCLVIVSDKLFDINTKFFFIIVVVRYFHLNYHFSSYSRPHC